MPSRRRVPRELRARFVLLGAEQQHERRCRAASTLPEGHDQASKGEKKTERNEEPGVPPGEGCPSHPLEDAKPLDVAHDSTEEDRHESPIPSDKQPTRQGGAPQPESAQHDKTRGEEEDRHQKSSRSRRLEQRRAVLLRNRHVGPPLPSRGPIDVQEAEREKDSGGRYADETGYCLLSSICCPATMSARFWAISTAPLTKARFTGDNLVGRQPA